MLEVREIFTPDLSRPRSRRGGFLLSPPNPRCCRLANTHGGGGGGSGGLGGGGGGGGGGEQQRPVFGPGLSVEKLKEMTKVRLQQQQGPGQGRSSPPFTGRALSMSSTALGSSLGSNGGGVGSGGSGGHHNERTEWRRSGSAGSAAMMEEHHRVMAGEDGGASSFRYDSRTRPALASRATVLTHPGVTAPTELVAFCSQLHGEATRRRGGGGVQLRCRACAAVHDLSWWCCFCKGTIDDC